MKSLFAKSAAIIFNLWYKICCLQPRRKEVLFVSRQFDKPSYNFYALGTELENHGWSVVYHTKHLTKSSVLPYIVHVFEEISYLARCRICILDRYDPVVCLLKFKYEPEDSTEYNRLDGKSFSEIVHKEFPKEPIVIQLWHAFGAFKKFGYQSLGTTEGHDVKTASVFKIHHNYSWIVCTGEDNRQAFAEAFSCPMERVVSLGLPEYDKLCELKKRNKEKEDACIKEGQNSSLKVLFAPTLRKSAETPHPFHTLQQNWKDLHLDSVSFAWSFHPLEEGEGAALDVSEALLDCDIVITDYSSIVYEAYLLDKMFAFYIPDLLEYKISPGLNSDPEELAPHVTFFEESSLKTFLECLAVNRNVYDWEEARSFANSTFDSSIKDCTSHLVDFVEHVSHVKDK